MLGTNEIRFDGWTLRLDSGELTRGGAIVRLQAQPLHVLQALLEHPGEVVPREALVARLWPSGIVDFDTALNSAVRRLRHALDDIADKPRYIETIPRRGYRFIGRIGTTEAPRAEAPPPETPAPGPIARLASSREPLFRTVALAFAALLALVALGVDRYSRANAPRHEAVPTMPFRDDGEAASRYREARYFYQRRAPGDLDRARTRFEQAVALNPASAPAYAGLASTYFMQAIYGEMDRDAGLAHSHEAAERAVALDPRNAEGHYRLATWAHFTNNQRLADEEMRKAIALDPAGAIALSARSSNALAEGHVDEGLALARKAVAAEPLALNYRYNLASALFFAGRFEEAKQVNLEALELSPEYESDIAAMSMILERKFDDALALIERWPDGPERQECLALAYFGLHRNAEADDALVTLIRTAGTSDPLRIVEVYAYRGEEDAALRWLDSGTALLRDAHTRHPESILPWMLRLSPFAAPLHGTPQWNAWVATLNRPASSGQKH